MPGRQTGHRLLPNPPTLSRGGPGKEVAGETAPSGASEDTPKFPGSDTPPPPAGTCRGLGRGPAALGPGLISVVLIPSLGKTCQWRKARRGEGGLSLLWARCRWSPGQRKPRACRGQSGVGRAFSGSFAPQSKDKESFLASQVSDCTSSFFVWDREGPSGARQAQAYDSLVYRWSGIGGHSQGVERLQIWSLWGWKGIYLDCQIPPAWDLERKPKESDRSSHQPLSLSKPQFSTP